MKIIFIRHTAVDVPAGVCYGRSDVGLAGSFDEESASVASRLGKYTFDHVFTSPLSRCVKLAGRCGFPDAEKDWRLSELDFGEWEMQRFDDITDPRLQEWYDDYENVRPTGGESFMDQQHRVKDFLDGLRTRCHDSDTVAIFAHAGILMHAMILCLGMTTREAVAHQPGYGDLLEVTW